MSNIMQVPAHIMARQQARKANDQKSAIISAVVSEGFAFPKISVRSSRYRLVEDGVETPVGVTLDVIIVGANNNISKIYYSKPFDGSLDVRPDCFSNDGVRPDPSVQEPVNDSCKTCPHNVLGSRVTPSGAKSKICSDQRHLAVVAAADPTKVYALTVPISAMKNLREYFKGLQNYGVSPEEVVTELGFDDAASFPKITFRHKDYVPAKAIERIDAIVSSDEVKEVIRLIPPSNRGPALAAPAAAPALAKPAAPAVEEGYEDEGATAQAPVEKPAPVKASKPVSPTPSQEDSSISGLESKLDALFDDE